jgi:tetratricopeptide (TPR) repeat protein
MSKPVIDSGAQNVATFDLFISYSRRDDIGIDRAGSVTALHDLIRCESLATCGSHPLRTFFDVEDIRDIDDWRHRILGALRDSKLLLVCLSPNYFTSDNCEWEWREFLQRHGHQYLEEAHTIVAIQVAPIPPEIIAQHQAWYDSVRRAKVFSFDISELQADSENAQAFGLVQAIGQRLLLANRANSARSGNLRATNERFIGRKRELRALHESLALGSVGSTTILHGLGGMGKTELAVFYANEHAHCYSGGIWWIDCEHKSDLPSAFASLSDQLLDDATIPKTVAEQFQRVMSELERRSSEYARKNPTVGAHAPVLVLLDNLSVPAMFGVNQRALFQGFPWLFILATAREKLDEWASASRVVVIDVEALDSSDAVALIRVWQSNQTFVSADEELAAQELVRDLGSYTLAVEQAAIYLGFRLDKTIRAFHQQLCISGLSRLDTISAADDESQAAILHREKQLACVLDQTLPAADSIARQLLDDATQWHPDALPVQWVQESTRLRQPGFSLRAKPEDQDVLSDAWRSLTKRALVKPTTEKLARMHRLIRHYLLQALLPEVADKVRTTQDNRLRAEVYKLSKFTGVAAPWQYQAMHAWVSDEPPKESSQVDVVFDFLGPWLTSQGRVEEALECLSKAVQIREERLLTEQSNSAKRDLIESLSKLCDIKLTLGDLDGALAMAQSGTTWARDLYLQLPAKYGRDLMLMLNRCGEMHYLLGCFEQAKLPLFEALGIAQVQLKASPQCAIAQNDLAGSLIKIARQLKPDESELATQCLQQALEIRTDLFNKDPNSIVAQRNLGLVTHSIGQLAEKRALPDLAIASFQHALLINQLVSRRDPGNHGAVRDVAICHGYLARASKGAGLVDQARAQYTESAAIMDSLIELDHNNAIWLQDSADAHWSLAVLEGEAGKPEAYRHMALLDVRFNRLRELQAFINKNNDVKHKKVRELLKKYAVLQSYGDDKK